MPLQLKKMYTNELKFVGFFMRTGKGFGNKIAMLYLRWMQVFQM